VLQTTEFTFFLNKSKRLVNCCLFKVWIRELRLWNAFESDVLCVTHIFYELSCHILALHGYEYCVHYARKLPTTAYPTPILMAVIDSPVLNHPPASKELLVASSFPQYPVKTQGDLIRISPSMLALTGCRDSTSTIFRKQHKHKYHQSHNHTVTSHH
jgi:hypothetical protein